MEVHPKRKYSRSKDLVKYCKVKYKLKIGFFEKYPLIHAVDKRLGEYYSIPDKHVWEYPNGTFIGKMTNKKRNGLGLLLYHAGMYYEGEWMNDHFHGKGIFIFSNGDYYEGHWSNSFPDEHGTYFNNNSKWKYEG